MGEGPDFYGTSAQVLPVLLLILVIETRLLRSVIERDVMPRLFPESIIGPSRWWVWQAERGIISTLLLQMTWAGVRGVLVQRVAPFVARWTIRLSLVAEAVCLLVLGFGEPWRALRYFIATIDIALLLLVAIALVTLLEQPVRPERRPGKHL